MGKPTGFLEYERRENNNLAPKDRIKNYEEFHNVLDQEERKKQAARCMNCGVPMCQSAIRLSGMVTGCPLHNLIPEWNDEIYHGHIEHALSRLLKTNNFPEFTGRVCPELCEKACLNGRDGDSVTIHDNELYLIEKAFEMGYMKPCIPDVRSGKSVAVVGSGPSGLAVADQLNHRGHTVTVIERENMIGGLLMYGIPNMKLDKGAILRRQKLMEEEGVVFKTGINVGVDISKDEIMREYDAVVLCCGAKKPRTLGIEGADETDGIYYAVDFLKANTKHLLDPEKEKPISAKDRDVVIVGGGDTGNDCVGTCIRQGAKSVTQLEMMPKPPIVRQENNPWPEWPKVLKTDYGQEEAIAVFGHDPREYETTVKEIITQNGKLAEIKTNNVRFENRQMIEVPDSEKNLKCDLLIIAAGFVGCEDYISNAFGLQLTNRNSVATEENHYRTNYDNVFTAGDMHRGQSLVVWAISEGREAAREVDEYLMGYTNM
ncbi:MAG: glutamate synthase subunit beta [Lachnospiraceae bacterium]|nr:glutamate synthase subunit beta [Lachnospiraceae bacterium]